MRTQYSTEHSAIHSSVLHVTRHPLARHVAALNKSYIYLVYLVWYSAGEWWFSCNNQNNVAMNEILRPIALICYLDRGCRSNWQGSMLLLVLLGASVSQAVLVAPFIPPSHPDAIATRQPCLAHCSQIVWRTGKLICMSTSTSCRSTWVPPMRPNLEGTSAKRAPPSSHNHCTYDSTKLTWIFTEVVKVSPHCTMSS